MAKIKMKKLDMALAAKRSVGGLGGFMLAKGAGDAIKAQVNREGTSLLVDAGLALVGMTLINNNNPFLQGAGAGMQGPFYAALYDKVRGYAASSVPAPGTMAVPGTTTEATAGLTPAQMSYLNGGMAGMTEATMGVSEATLGIHPQSA